MPLLERRVLQPLLALLRRPRLLQVLRLTCPGIGAVHSLLHHRKLLLVLQPLLLVLQPLRVLQPLLLSRWMPPVRLLSLT